jgi:hypothetical protein
VCTLRFQAVDEVEKKTCGGRIYSYIVYRTMGLIYFAH